LTIRLYRNLLKQCRLINRISNECLLDGKVDKDEKCDRLVLLQPNLDPRDWGRARTFQSPCLRDQSSSGSPDNTTNIIHFLFRNLDRKKHASSVISNTNDSPNVNVTAGESKEDESVLVSGSEIMLAVKKSFRSSPGHVSEKNKRIAAIDAIRLFNQQLEILNLTSITTDTERKIRVIATSRYIGLSSSKGDKDAPRYRFAYRIRVENFNCINKVDKIPLHVTSSVQLLGRTWEIVEEMKNGEERNVAKTSAVNGGAVGRLPVIHPGDVFEYMSGCELVSTRGKMSGYFTMAIVPDDTKSAKLGDDSVKAFQLPKEHFFDMPVGPFLLKEY